ncbi:MAG: hypothetical protein KAI71_00450 [Candidatus Pacebacteria bacterium]|nr:hypothetical protein [Candidatus Paceibacterota bacterium]
MKKTKLLGLLIIVLGLFFAKNQELLHAFSLVTVCQMPLTTFSDGNPTFDVSFPPGGGTTCLTIADCPKVLLPANGTVYSVKVDMELTDPTSEIGTPYIWIPNSGSNTLVQLRTSDGTMVKLYQNSIDGFPASAFNNPSRITVMPGGDTYVANRGNQYTTRLTPNPAPSEEYSYGGQLDMGAGETLVRAATFDKDGNIWTGTCNSASGLDKIKVFCGNISSCGIFPIGTELASLSNGICNYGMIGDGYGFVWGVGNSTLVSYSYAAGVITQVDSHAVANSYGLGIDNDANIWVARWKVNGSAFKIVRDTTGNVISSIDYPSGVTGGGRGIAGDRDNNNWLVIDDDTVAWTTNPSRVIKYSSAGTVIGNFVTGTGATGAAIDFDNNVWVVNYGGDGPNFIDPNLPDATCYNQANDGMVYNGGTVTKLQSDGTVIATYPTCGNNPYNYSDMTGLRTVPKSIVIGGATVPISAGGTFDICTDGTGTCTDGTNCVTITTFLSTCSPDASGDCEVPLEIFSMQIGDYTLKNLEIIYGKQTPVTTGGIIPCGRAWDDPATAWDDRQSCDFCYIMMLLNQITNFLIKIAGIIAVLAIIVTGFLFITSAGNSERKNNAKTTLKWVILGFLIIFLSWLLIDFLLSAWGYLDPLGGKWDVVCD